MPGHTGGICVFISPSPPVLSLPVTEGQVVGGAIPGTRSVRCKYILGITGLIDTHQLYVVTIVTKSVGLLSLLNCKHLLNTDMK